MDYLQRFDKITESFDAEFIAMCNMRIMEAEHRMEMCKIDLTYWQEIKKIHKENSVSPMESE